MIEIILISIVFFGILFFFFLRKRDAEPNPEDVANNLIHIANRIKSNTQEGKYKALKEAFEEGVPALEEQWICDIQKEIDDQLEVCAPDHQWNKLNVYEVKFDNIITVKCKSCGCLLHWNDKLSFFPGFSGEEKKSGTDDEPIPHSCAEYRMRDALR